jgi:hypothetical protein
MNALPRYCYCWDGRSRWPLRPEDRVCGQCGRRLLAAEPLDPLLSPGPPPAVALYLHALGTVPGAQPPRSLAGCLRFQMRGLHDGQLWVQWTPLDGAVLELMSFRLTLGVLLLDFQLPAPRLPPAGRCGEGLLALHFQGQRLEFRVEAFVTAGLRGTVWSATRSGKRSDRPNLTIYRGAVPTQTFLEYELGADVPVQWETLTCDHPAVTFQPLQSDRAAPVVRAEVRWDPARLRQDVPGEELLFRLHLRGLPVHDHRQYVWWRLRNPLLCQPAGLVVARLSGERPQSHRICLRNVDRQTLTVQGVESEVPWVAGPDLSAGCPLRLEPGASATVRLELRPEALNGDQAPHLGRVAFRFAERGSQLFTVRVDAVRRLRPLDGPLLLDPGPPCVVLGRLDPATGRAVYLRCSGDAGLEPARFGWTPEEYAQVVYGNPPPESAWQRLVAQARARVREWEHLEAREVLVCRQPWMSGQSGPGGVRTRDWGRLCLEHATPGLPPPAFLVRLDAWGASLVDVRGAAEARDCVAPLGGALVRWLVRRFRLVGPRQEAALFTWSQQPLAALGPGEPPPVPPWAWLACEALLADYRWGPAYAWRRLLGAWWENVPETRQVAFDLHEADQYLRLCVVEQARRLGDWVRRQLPPGAPAPACTWVSALFGSTGYADLLRSTVPSAGLEAACVAPAWVEWLGRDAARQARP